MLCLWLESKKCPKEIIDLIKAEGYNVGMFTVFSDYNAAVGTFQDLDPKLRLMLIKYANDSKEELRGDFFDFNK